MNIENKIQAINAASGYNYICLKSGDLYLIDCNKKVEIPNFDSMKDHIKESYEMVFHFIYDREAYEKLSTKGTFSKSVKISEIIGMKQHGRIVL